MNDAARAVIFGRDAVNYDRFRPTYPSEAIEFVLGLSEGTDFLEIGAGTGIATEAIARPGLAITCVEPSPDMAEVLSRRGLPGVEVFLGTFEDWDDEDAGRDLIYAAQAWHWVDHESAYKKALRVLRPGGAIALMWNVLQHRYDLFEDIYRRYAPQIIDGRDERIRKRDHHTWSDDLSVYGFAHVDRFTHVWDVTLGAAGYASLCATYSDHMLVPEPERSRLLAAIEAAVDGSVTIEYRTEVFCGRKVDA